MIQNQTPTQHESVQDSLERVVALLYKHGLVESLVHKQDMPRHDLVQQLVHRQNLAELQQTLDTLHPADVAYILEALPLDQRLVVWDLVRAERDGEILLEVSDAVRESLIANMDSNELRAAAEHLDTDEIADLAPDLPQEVIQDVFESLDKEEQAQLQSALSYPEGTVGALMDFDMVTIHEDVTLEQVLGDLRKLGELPNQTDKLFVVGGKRRVGHGRLARGRRYVRLGMEIHAQPLDLARRQPGDCVHRVRGDRCVRGINRDAILKFLASCVCRERNSTSFRWR
jgi:magnesium transporter